MFIIRNEIEMDIESVRAKSAFFLPKSRGEGPAKEALDCASHGLSAVQKLQFGYLNRRLEFLSSL